MARFQSPLHFSPFDVVRLRRCSTREFRAELRKRGLCDLRERGERRWLEGELADATRSALAAFRLADEKFQATLDVGSQAFLKRSSALLESASS